MGGKHLALIVEDDHETADDLSHILSSLSCRSIIATTKEEALARLHTKTFCLVLLDLQIKEKARAIKGHEAHGMSLLREIRKRHPEHAGLCHWMPILIVSGYAREVAAAIAVMKDGANDLIYKPLKSSEVSAAVRQALERSGRTSHSLCGAPPAAVRAGNPGEPIVISISGERNGRRTFASVGLRKIELPDRLVRILLRLMVAHASGREVSKTELGGRDDQGFKGISELREKLRPALERGVEIISNDHHGNYGLTGVVVGACDASALAGIGDNDITMLAQQLQQRPRRRRPKV